MLELDGSQLKVLRTGLLSAFVGPDAFDVFLREDLDRCLNFYAGPGDPFPIAVFKLIDWAQAEGWIDELVVKAYKARPRNRDIADIAQAFGVAIDTSNLKPAGPIQHEPPLWHSFNPYRGLLALREEDANFLFGRDEDIAQFIATLAENPSKLVLAMGASGVGKSSLIFAGVFAALDRQSLRGGKPWPEQLSQSRTWPRLTLTPGPEPLRSLAGAFVRQWLDPRQAKFREETNNWRQLFLKGDKIDGLIEALDSSLLTEKGDKPSRYLLYIDQGEELYTRGGREPNLDGTQRETNAQQEARRFSALVADAARHPRLVAIMSARSDFLGRLQADAPLHAVKQQFDIVPLTPQGLAEVVRRPAAALDVDIEPGLDEALISNTREQAGGLPLLSDTLASLWKEMQGRGDGTLRWSRPLRNGVDVALKLCERADGFVSVHKDRDLVRRLFCVRLAYVPMQGAATRRTALLEELTEPERALVAELAGPEQRILVTAERDGKATAEVAHEALFTGWQSLRDWIATRRAFYAWVTQNEADRKDWENQAKPSSALLTGRPLQRARSFLEREGEEVPAADRAFIEASIKADEEVRERRKEEERKRQETAAEALQIAEMAARFSPTPSSGRATNGQPSRLPRLLRGFHINSLTKRVFAINVIGVAILVSGIFYLNQYRYKFMGNRVETLTTQAQIIAVAIAQTSKTNIDTTAESGKAEVENRIVVPSGLSNPEFSFRVDPEVVSPILRDLIAPTKTRARVFDTDGTLISDSRQLHRRSGGPVEDSNPGPEPGFLTDLWDYFRSTFWTPDLPLYKDLGPEGKAYEEVRVALAGSVSPLIRVNEEGVTIISIAVPIQRDRSTLGALLLTAQGSDIDEMIAQDRIQIVEVAGFVALVTAILSWISTRTVIETMRRIGAAAERLGKGTENGE